MILRGISLLTGRFSVMRVLMSLSWFSYDSLEFSMTLPSIKLNKENTRLFSIFITTEYEFAIDSK